MENHFSYQVRRSPTDFSLRAGRFFVKLAERTEQVKKPRQSYTPLAYTGLSEEGLTDEEQQMILRIVADNLRRLLGSRKRLHGVSALLSLTLIGSAAAQESTQVRGERIIDRTTSAWMSQQIQEPCILENPKDPSRLVMFYSGVPAADRSTCFVGKAWAHKSDPFVWHQDPNNPVFKPGSAGWDSRSLRLDCVLYIPEEDSYYIYYSATDVADAQNRIGLAICPAGKDGYSEISPETIRRYGTAPVLAPEPAEPFFETMASQSAVYRERDASGQWRWYMYYSYRGRNGVLPGIRLATSRDGKSWTRQECPEDPSRKGHLFESTPNAYYEWHQIFKVDDTYVLSIEVGPERGSRWRTVLAVSRHPDKGWEQLDLDTVVQTRWPGIYSDETIFHVATPAFYRFDDRWYLYTQACPLPANRNYIDGKWDLWCFECNKAISTRPGLAELFIPGTGTEK